MRLWHKDLIDILPQKQLIAQWRECCAIARNIAVDGTPNHLLVNKILDYPIEHFWAYSMLVANEMIRRGYSCNLSAFTQWASKKDIPEYLEVSKDDLFHDWHTKKYLWQCYSNLEEKHDCGGIPEDDWVKIENRMKEVVLV